MAIISSTLERIKSDPLPFLGGAEFVNQLFAKVGHVWRTRIYDPAHTMSHFMIQVLNGNTAISHLRLLTKTTNANSSYSEARARLPLLGVAAMVDAFTAVASDHKSPTWRGRRVIMADATNTLLPDTKEQQKLYPQPSAQKPGCGFPVIKILGLMNALSGIIIHATMMAMNVHEMSVAGGMHAVLRARDVLLGDRGFCSFAHVAMLAKLSVDAVFRVHQQQIVDFTPGRAHRPKKGKRQQRGIPTSRFVCKLGDDDQVVDWVAPPKPSTWMTLAFFLTLPKTVRMREILYHIQTKGFRTKVVIIATTLLDPVAFPKEEIAKLYGLRWQIELNFRHLKTTMKMEHLKCKTPDGTAKELMVFMMVYNIVRGVMVVAAERQGIEDANRISFIDALRWLCAQLMPIADGELIELIVNPTREPRFCPRVLKKRQKPYDLMNKPRHMYRGPQENQEIMR